MTLQISNNATWYFKEGQLNLHIAPEWYFDLLYISRLN